MMPDENISKANDLTGRSINLSGLIDYRQDAVVSKTVVARNTGTVTLFAFDEGQGLSEHSTPYDALVLVLDGEAVITIDGKEQTTRNGEMIIMPANHPHALKAAVRFKMMLVMIKS